MPTYDYRCEANEQVYEVKHAIAQTVSTWGELCEVADIDPQGIPAETAVKKLISTAGVVKSSSLKNPEAPPCMTGGGCSGACGM